MKGALIAKTRFYGFRLERNIYILNKKPRITKHILTHSLAWPEAHLIYSRLSYRLGFLKASQFSIQGL